MNKKTVIDLFCGCGGLSQGFIDAGYKVILGIDHWKDAISTFNHNHENPHGIVGDLLNESPETISSKTGITKADIIIGGSPCQGFSIAGKRIIEDERNELYKSFVKFVDYYKPKVFLMENVPNILSMGKGLVKEKIIKDFEKTGYTVNTDKLLASNYGVPQNRERAFFIGFKNGHHFEFPKTDTIEHITSADAISDLTEQSLEDGTDYPITPLSN